jgi:hypothetical protein
MSSFKLTANIELTVRDREGRIIRQDRFHNTVVDDGLNAVRDLLGGWTFEPDEMAIGDSDTAVQTTDSALGNEVFRGTIDRRIQGDKKVTYQWLLGTGDANGETIKESGLFEQGTMLARALVSPTVSKTALISVTISHELTVGRG